MSVYTYIFQSITTLHVQQVAPQLIAIIRRLNRLTGGVQYF